MIEFNQVSFRYKPHTTNVIDNFNLTINRGEWIALVGHNGSGKSTVAKLINGLLMPNDGIVTVDGTQVSQESIYEIRKHVGMIFQNPENQFVGTTVIDDVAFGLENLGVPRDEMIGRIDESLKQVDMALYKWHEPIKLSGGQKQRVAIAGVLAMRPDVIVFDEATSMLDPTGKKELIQMIRSLHEKHHLTVITITHDLNEAAYADRVVALSEGEVWFQGAPRRLFQYGEKLQEVGLEPTFVTRVYSELQKHSIEIKQEPLHFKELVDELWTSYLKT
ncbi:energy-coupling factor ABC transporter ATP-binding protein [Alkalibacillus silvisoli]|uniref:Energy-coupling factor ABC transporter ATP-binding protein n=1 Tax=Alkalibacillus silvisoli TaxID=392823 RepID=A0ABP3K5I0_9BACI